MKVVSDYRDHRIEVRAVGAGDGRWNAEVKTRPHFPLEVKPRTEVITCLKTSADHAETRGVIWACLWIDNHGEPT